MKVKNIFKRWASKKSKPDFGRIEFVESLADVPLNPGVSIFIVSDGSKNKWVVFECPNKCGKRIEVNLMRSRYPYWTLKIKRKKISLYPSVVVQGCGAHFWLTESKVIEAKFPYEEK